MKSARLSRAIKGLYSAFESVPKPQTIDACPCCNKHEDVCRLLEMPLDNVPTQPLSTYAFSAFFTVGSEADFRYLLPRILELAVTDPDWYADLEVVLPKLRLAQWDKWPKHQVDAVEEFLAAGFEAAIRSSDEPGRAVDSWLCGLARAHADLRPFQTRLLEPDAAPALREMYEWNSHKLYMKRKLENQFWADSHDEMLLVAGWLKSPEVQARVQ